MKDAERFCFVFGLCVLDRVCIPANVKPLNMRRQLEKQAGASNYFTIWSV